jgi:hypothetical protein
MAKTPRSRNADDKVIQGKELDAYISRVTSYGA